MKLFTETYINNSDNMVNEWLFFGRKKDKDQPAAQEKKGTGFFGSITNFMNRMGLLSSAGKKSSALQEAFKTIASEKAANAKTRQKELLDSKEGAMAAKLLAKHKHNENQLNLKNKQRVNVYNAEKTRLDSCAERWKNNSTVYTQEENDAYNNTLDNELKSLEGTDIYENCQKINDLRRMIAIDENGNPRDIEDIKATLADSTYNPELSKMLEEWNKTVEGNSDFQSFLNDTPNDKLKEILGDVSEGIVNETVDNENLANDRKTAENLLKEQEAGADALETYNKAIEDYNKINDKIKENGDDVTKLKEQYGVPAGADGITSETSKENLSLKGLTIHPDVNADDIRAAISKENLFTNSDGNFVSPDEYKTNLSKAGVPEDMATKIVEKYKNAQDHTEDMGSFVTTYITGDNSIITDNDCEDFIKTNKKSFEQQKIKLDAKKNALIEQQESTPNPEEMTEEEIREKFGDSANSIIKGKEISNDPLNKDTYDRKSEEYKKQQTAISNEIKKIKDKQQALLDSRDANLLARNAAAEHYKENVNNQVPDELKASVNSKVKDVENGEFINSDGKRGYYEVTRNNNGKLVSKFIEHPGINADPDELEEYKTGRDKALAQTPAEYYEQRLKEEPVIKSAEKKENGKYTVTYEDGNTVEMDEDRLVRAYARRNWMVSAKITTSATKADNLKKLNSVLTTQTNSDGKTVMTINSEAIKKLKDPDRSIIQDMLSNPQNYDFSGANLSNVRTITDKDGEIDLTKIHITDKDGNLVPISKEKDMDDIIDNVMMDAIDSNNEEDIKDHTSKNDGEDDEENDIDYDEEDTEDVDDSDDIEEVPSDPNDQNGGKPKKKLLNPSKIWHRKKNKLTNKSTKNYYKNIGTKDEQSISPEEFAEKKAKYQKRKKRLEQKKKDTQTTQQTTGETTTTTTGETTTTTTTTTGESLSITLKANIVEHSNNKKSYLKVYLKENIIKK